MGDRRRLKPQQGTLRYRVYIEVKKRSLFGKAATTQDVIRALLCSDEPVKHRTVRAYLAELAQNGYIKKLGFGQYAALEFRKTVQLVSFREALLHQLQTQTTVEALMKTFPGRSKGTIRKTLDRLKKQGLVTKEGSVWVVEKLT